jgi:hypothetical protein
VGLLSLLRVGEAPPPTEVWTARRAAVHPWKYADSRKALGAELGTNEAVQIDVNFSLRIGPVLQTQARMPESPRSMIQEE